MADGTFDEVLSAMKTELIPQERIERTILVLRDHKVMLDADLPASTRSKPKRW